MKSKPLLPILALIAILAPLPVFAQADDNITAYPPPFFVDARPVTALDMVQRIPGFLIENGANVRGLAGTAGNVLIDGQRPASKTDTASGALSRIQAGEVLRIDLVRGGAPGIDMGGHQMVVNIIRRAAPAISGALSLLGTDDVGTDRNGSYRADLTANRKVGDHLLEGELNYEVDHDDGWVGHDFVRVGPGGGVIAHSKSQNTGRGGYFTANGAGEFGAFGGKARLNGAVFNTDSKAATVETYQFGGADRREQDTDNGGSGELGARYTHPLSDGGSWESDLIGNWSNDDSRSTSVTASGVSQGDSKRRTNETVARSTLKFQPRTNLEVDAGIEGAFNQLNGTSTFIQAGSNTPIPGSRADVQELRGEASGMATWQTSDAITLAAGLNYERSTLTALGHDKPLAFWKPSLQASFKLDASRQLQLRVERSVGQLNFSDYLARVSLSTGVITAGAADLTPTQTWRLSTQFTQAFWDKGSIGLTAQANWMDDVIDRVQVTGPGGSFSGAGNIGEGFIGRVIGNLVLPLDRLGISGGRITASAQQDLISRVTDPVTDQTRRISGGGYFNYDFVFRQDIQHLRTDWGITANQPSKAVSYRPDGRDISKAVKPSLGLFIEYKPSDKITLRLDGRNLLSHGSDSRREVYAGRRDATPLSYVDVRTAQSRPTVRLNLTLGFGGQ